MSKRGRVIVGILGVFLLILGFGNILDDARVLVYDLTAIFAGSGFIVIAVTYKR